MGASSRPTRLLVVDDHPMFRLGLTSLIRTAPMLEVVGESSTTREAVPALSLSEHTVKTYISNVLQKLQMTRQSELAAFVTRLRQYAQVSE